MRLRGYYIVTVIEDACELCSPSIISYQKSLEFVTKSLNGYCGVKIGTRPKCESGAGKEEGNRFHVENYLGSGFN